MLSYSTDVPYNCHLGTYSLKSSQNMGQCHAPIRKGFNSLQEEMLGNKERARNFVRSHLQASAAQGWSNGPPAK